MWSRHRILHSYSKSNSHRYGFIKIFRERLMNNKYTAFGLLQLAWKYDVTSTCKANGNAPVKTRWGVRATVKITTWSLHRGMGRKMSARIIGAAKWNCDFATRYFDEMWMTDDIAFVLPIIRCSEMLVLFLK